MSHNYRPHQQWSWTRMLIHTKVPFLCSKHHRNRAERCYRVGSCGVRQKKKKKNRHWKGVGDWDRRRKKRPRGALATGGRKASGSSPCLLKGRLDSSKDCSQSAIIIANANQTVRGPFWRAASVLLWSIFLLWDELSGPSVTRTNIHLIWDQLIKHEWEPYAACVPISMQSKS